MPQSEHGEVLAQKYYRTVVLRLVLDRRGRLERGEILDAAGRPWQRFVGWRGLSRAVRAWLAADWAEHGPEGASAGARTSRGSDSSTGG